MPLLSVTVVGCRGLRKSDYIGLSDPYVKVEMIQYDTNGIKQETSKEPKMTRIKKNTRNPTWNQSFAFYPFMNENIDPNTLGITLSFKVYDYDAVNVLNLYKKHIEKKRETKDDFLGSATVDLKTLQQVSPIYKGEEIAITLQLYDERRKGEKVGELDIIICPEDFGKEREEVHVGPRDNWINMIEKIPVHDQMPREYAERIVEGFLWKKAFDAYEQRLKEKKLKENGDEHLPIRNAKVQEKHIKYTNLYDHLIGEAKFKFYSSK